MKKKNKDLVHQQFQNKLRKKYKFRIIVFVISVFISILFIPYNTVSPALWGVLLGIGGSGLTWALFEFFDLSLNVYEEYSREFYDYFSNVNDHWTKIKKAFKTLELSSQMQHFREKAFIGRKITKAFARAKVQFVDLGLNVSVRQTGKILRFGEILPQQAVGVLICSTLPGMMRKRKIELNPKCGRNGSMI